MSTKDSTKKSGKQKKASAKKKARASEKARAVVSGTDEGLSPAKSSPKKEKAAKKAGDKAAAKGKQGTKPGKATGVGAATREQAIAELAYFLSQQRQQPGWAEMDDWLQAEKVVDRLLKSLS